MTIVSQTDVTIDAFLGGRVEAFQPASGHHRSGLEAVLLAAALDEDAGGTIVDLGAGAGVAGMCAAARCPAVGVTLVEREPVLVDCARRSLRAEANRDFAARVSVAEVDLAAPEDARIEAGLKREAAATVLANPPFHIAGAVRASPAAARASAHVLDAGLDDWFRAAAWALRPGGELIIISLAAAVADILAALAGRFGGASLLPLHSRPGLPAERLLLRAVKGSRTAPSILPGLTLHGPAGPAFTPELDRMLREGAGLAEIHAPWRRPSRSPS